MFALPPTADVLGCIAQHLQKSTVKGRKTGEKLPTCHPARADNTPRRFSNQMTKLVVHPKTVLLPHTGKTQLWLHSISTYWFSKTKSFQIHRKGISLLQRVLHSNALELVNHTQKWRFFFLQPVWRAFLCELSSSNKKKQYRLWKREEKEKVARVGIEPTAAAPSLDVSRSNHWAGSRLLFLSSLSKHREAKPFYRVWHAFQIWTTVQEAKSSAFSSPIHLLTCSSSADHASRSSRQRSGKSELGREECWNCVSACTQAQNMDW